MLHVFIDFKAIFLCRFRDAIDDGAGLGTAYGVDQPPIMLPDAEAAQRGLGRIVVQQDFAIFEEHPQVFLLVQGIRDAFPRFFVLYGFQHIRIFASRMLLASRDCQAGAFPPDGLVHLAAVRDTHLGTDCGRCFGRCDTQHVLRTWEAALLGGLSGDAKVCIVTGCTDMRRSLDGLMAIIRNAHRMDPYADAPCLFCGRKDF